MSDAAGARARYARAAPVVASLLLCLSLAGAVIDDAYISLRYASRLAAGQGLSFNPGPPTEGFTNLSWTLLAALARRLSISPLAVWFLVGVASAALLTEHARRRARALSNESPAGGMAAGLSVGCSLGLALYANSGLETVPYALAHTLAVSALARRRGASFAAWTSLAFATRPEAGLTGLMGAALLAWEVRRGRASRRELALALAVFAALVAPLLAWKRWYFGAWLPLTLSAKPPDRGEGLAYLAPFVGYGAVMALGALHALARGPFARRVYGAFGLVGLAAAALEGGDWMPLQRLLLPSLPLLAIAADAWVAAAWDRLRDPRATRGARGAALAPLALTALWIGRNLAGVPEVQSWVAARQATDDVRAALARELAARGARSVALVDIGVVGDAAPSLRVVDLGGLTDPALARSPGGHLDKTVDRGWFLRASPDVVALNDPRGPVASGGGRATFTAQYGVERRLVASPWFRERYAYACTVNVARAYLMHLFTRAGAAVTLPPRCAPVPSLAWMRPPGSASAACCITRPRVIARRRPSSVEIAPEAAAAASSPREWPANHPARGLPAAFQPAIAAE